MQETLNVDLIFAVYILYISPVTAQLLSLCSSTDIREASSLEDDDDDFDPVPPSVATTTATSEQSTESCDTSPDVISPTISRCSEELSQENPDTPISNSPERAVLLDEGPDSVNI